MFPFSRCGQNCPSMFYGVIDFASAQWHGSLQFAKQKSFNQKQTIFTLHMPGIPHILQTHISLSLLFVGKKEKSKTESQTQEENKQPWRSPPSKWGVSTCCCGCFDSSPAGLLSASLPSQLPVHGLDQDFSRRKGLRRSAKGEIFLTALQPSRLSGPAGSSHK